MKQIYFLLAIISMSIVLGACSEDETFDIQYQQHDYHKAENKAYYHNIDSCTAQEMKKTDD